MKSASIIADPNIKQKPAASAETRTVTGAEAIILSLLAEGVEKIFGYPGGAIMPTYDVLYNYENQLEHILVRHEQGAVHAAQGYARASGEVGVCVATSGPGATNLITGIADAYLDSTPVVCITGQVFASLLGTDAFQEIDILDISIPVTKWNYKVTTAAEIPAAMAKAFYVAKSGRPGPVLIDITKNAQMDALDFVYQSCHNLTSYAPYPRPSQLALAQAASLINQAQKPMVLMGQGVILGEAETEFLSFLERSGMPVASTVLGLSALPTDHPQYVGMLGMHGNYAPNTLTNECDVLVAVGMRFDDRVTSNLAYYAKQAQVIHLEIDPSEINKNVHADVAVLGDVKQTLPELSKLLRPKTYPVWLQNFQKLHAVEDKKIIQADLNVEGDELGMAGVIEAINQNCDDAILVTDVGQHQMATCRYAKFKQSRSLITSGGLGTMGFCLPAAIGAKFARPDRPVIGVVGDGGVQMTMQELGVMMQHQLAVKLIILNNQFLGMVRQWQELYFEQRYASTPMSNPDFCMVAESYGIANQKIDSPKALNQAIKDMLSHPGAYVLEVMVKQQENVFPIITPGASVADMCLESPESDVEQMGG
ncbi:biosynthetic-type acetolactate synthase large subunit [Marinicella sp. S1101]|uniref:biosynthetic-type acetolactate synthase large subunit n=1 Tax=Marinicella marina TaxID=2996016 RepID=UPI002260AE47|nr:biosynthetic-type acetolactate synthase large subunit [Marinicella marina]MCX7552763.1 biosynthetic-type acetolactate synthase large subunit [Marinicella marina]MDJ1139928.1 biosynthetic-type acetolactate synthase large subunit [Marinicella marina]